MEARLFKFDPHVWVSRAKLHKLKPSSGGYNHDRNNVEWQGIKQGGKLRYLNSETHL